MRTILRNHEEKGLNCCRDGKTNCSDRDVARKLQHVFEAIFGCWHRRLSRPFTLSGCTYEVCLDCGKQFPYVRVDLGHLNPGQDTVI